MTDRIEEAPGSARVVARTDVLVVGGGPAGFSAAIAAKREGCSVTLIERYPYLGGLASGGMVLVLDDMHNGEEVTVTGLCMEMIERMAKVGAAVYPPPEERGQSLEKYRKWARWGCHDFRSQMKPQPIVFAAAFDPDGWKRISNEMITEAGVNVRLHSWFSKAIVQDGRIRGVICETKAGREAIIADVVIDTTGDLDVAAAAGAKFIEGAYIVTTVFRLGNVDTEEAERFAAAEPEAFAVLDRQAKRTMGGSWDHWWLKTPLPGVVWCNCPHMTGYDGLKVEDLTRADFEGRKRIYALVDFVRANMPGFKDCFVVDVAPQLGIRQTRLLEGEYVVTKHDVMERVWFADTVARGRDYYTPYRSMLPKEVEGLIVAGRHYSATGSAQKMSREIPPCMSMGQSAGVAAALALAGNMPLRRVEARAICAIVRAQGGDPGDRPSANAKLMAQAGRAHGADGPDPQCRRGGEQFPCRRDGAHGARLRRSEQNQFAPNLCGRHRLRAHGSIRAQGRAGRVGTGDVRRDGAPLARKRPALGLCDNVRRLFGWHASVAGRAARAAAGGEDGPGPAIQCVAARLDDRRPDPGSDDTDDARLRIEL